MPRGSDLSHSNGRVSHPAVVNLFLDGDPEPAVPASTHRRCPKRPDQQPARNSRHARVVTIDGPVATGRPGTGDDAKRFELLGGRSGTPRGLIARADGNTRAACMRLAARPYVALVAMLCIACMLLALSWLGLSLRAAERTRHTAMSGQHVAHTAATRARDRVAELTAALNSTRHRLGLQTAALNRAEHQLARSQPRAQHAEHLLATQRAPSKSRARSSRQ
jgi:HAMP domain-containing protein